MEFAEVKDKFLQTLVINGISSIEEVPDNLTLGVPKTLLERWINQFKNAPLITAIPPSPRLINRFTLGADPEFTLVNNGTKYPAQKTGLQTGLAFGMDMNGRLIELRPSPSRFVLDVVASILVELRWMGTIHPELTQMAWHAMPFDGGDGCGGHVHFARKRDEGRRQDDIELLSNLYRAFYNLGVFHRGFCDQRTSHTKYGNLKDYRLQKHGYEYRAFPTWLDSPWLAYFVLTVTKLAMYNPSLFKSLCLTSSRNEKTLQKAITNLIAYYKNVDDDAWIAFHAIKKVGIPKQGGFDFRASWGIVYPHLIGAKADKRYYPSMIEPTENERLAIFHYLVNQYPIKPDRPICNWKPEAIHPSYEWMMNYIQTYHMIGVGEICSDLVTHKRLQIDIRADEDKNRITSYLLDNINCQAGIQALVNLVPNLTQQCNRSDDDSIRIYLPKGLRTNEFIPLVKRVLTSGLFPIWNVNDVKEGCFEEWVKKNKLELKPKMIGKELE